MKAILLILIFAQVLLSEVNTSLSCIYYKKDKNNYEPIMNQKKCISLLPSNDFINIKGNDVYVSKEVVKNAYYFEHNLSYLHSKGGPVYFTKQGKARRALSFDNGADYFKDGLARTIDKNHKIGYFDTNLTVIIKPIYDFAFPFENKKAIVCNGCVKKRIGEHSTMVGGKWGIIDINGLIIEPLIHSSFMETYKIISGTK